jgi:hypothetical protein
MTRTVGVLGRHAHARVSMQSNKKWLILHRFGMATLSVAMAP